MDLDHTAFAGKGAAVLAHPAVDWLFGTGAAGRIFILYGGKAFYHPDPNLDGSVCVAVLCVLSDVSSLL